MCVVSEPVVEDATAETTDDVSEEVAEEVVPVTISDTPAATSDAEEVTPDDGEDAVEAEPEPDSVAFPDNPTDLAERFPELSEAVQYQGAQKEVARLRREYGTAEATSARLIQIRQRLVANPDDEAGDIQRVLQDNALNVREQLEGAFLIEAARAQGWDQTQLDAAETLRTQLHGDDLSAYAREIITQGREQARAQVTAELGAESEATVAKRVGEERMADKIESKPTRTDPPATPAGRSPGGGTYGDVRWVQAQMAADSEWAHQMSPDGKTTNLARARPAIDALAQERKKQRAS